MAGAYKGHLSQNVGEHLDENQQKTQNVGLSPRTYRRQRKNC